MLDLLPQSLLSFEYYLKTELHAESIVPKGMCEHSRKKQNRELRSGGGRWKKDSRDYFSIALVLLGREQRSKKVK